ncbi:MAG: HEPN domain-containing protein [Chloroflexi bacterium]|nr:HEPN domain-containing protein [Chloroflexota bacterium]
MTEAEGYLAKASESLASARADNRARRYNSAANRAYYAAFQAAVAALIDAGIRPADHDWGHRFVISQFSGKLIRRRKLMPRELRSTLGELFDRRVPADYSTESVSAGDARGAVKRAGRLVGAVSAKTGTGSAREAEPAYGSEEVKTDRVVKARARGLIEEVKQIILQKYPNREFDVVEFGPKDYRLIVRGGRGDLEGIHKALDGRTTDILVDHDIWIVILAERKRRAA